MSHTEDVGPVRFMVGGTLIALAALGCSLTMGWTDSAWLMAQLRQWWP